MALLVDYVDPTLDAADRVLEAAQHVERRPRLGASSIGADCERRSWLDFRWASKIRHDAATLKRFADGHAGELVQAERLRLVDGVTLLTIAPDTGFQWGFETLGGHFGGSMDGAILGLIQAPKTWHVWEHKQVDQKKFDRLAKAKEKHGEKDALANWDTTYYAQAILYMHFSGMTRHYLTCSTPGGRSTIGCRTNENKQAAERLIDKASRIIFAPRPPEKISLDPDSLLCRWCPHTQVCQGRETLPERNCRTCLSATPLPEGGWKCERWDEVLDERAQRLGCSHHLFVPDLVPGRQEDAGADFVTYVMDGGEVWRDGFVDVDVPQGELPL